MTMYTTPQSLLDYIIANPPWDEEVTIPDVFFEFILTLDWEW
jgi:hypothetical protein